MTEASCAPAGHASAAAANTAARVRPNIFFLPGLIETSYGFDRAGGDQPLLAIIVHAFNERLETLVHEMALDLARRGHRLALFLGIERLGQDAKVLDLLDAGKLAVRALDVGADQSHHVGAGGEAGEAGMGHVVAASPIRYVSASISMRAVRYLRPWPNTIASAT